MVCNNWITAVRESFSSDYTDYSLLCAQMDSGFKEHHLDPVTSKEHFGKRADVMFAYIWLNVGQE